MRDARDLRPGLTFSSYMRLTARPDLPTSTTNALLGVCLAVFVAHLLTPTASGAAAPVTTAEPLLTSSSLTLTKTGRGVLRFERVQQSYQVRIRITIGSKILYRHSTVLHTGDSDINVHLTRGALGHLSRPRTAYVRYDWSPHTPQSSFALKRMRVIVK